MEGCIEWTLYRDRDGYGRQGRGRMAHRVVYEQVKGPIPEGLTIDHLCGNPPCVNPDHLEAVTFRENMARATKSAAQVQAAKTHCPQGHLYDEVNTYRWRDRSRQCRTCARERNRQRVRV